MIFNRVRRLCPAKKGLLPWMFLKIIVKLVEVSNSSFKLLYGLRRKDIELLEHIKTYFGAGKIHKHGSESVVLRVYSTKDMQVIISHLCARQKVSFNNKKNRRLCSLQASILYNNKQRTLFAPHNRRVYTN